MTGRRGREQLIPTRLLGLSRRFPSKSSGFLSTTLQRFTLTDTSGPSGDPRHLCFNMGIDTRPSHVLRQTSYLHNNTLPKRLESPSSLPDTSSNTSSASLASTTSWSQTVQCSSQSGVPVEQRQNPRRSSSAISKPPTLVRQDERKVSFVDSLVGKSGCVVDHIS